jgi:cell division protein ftsA
MARDIGIDLGTANILIYLKNRGIILNEPSLVAVDDKSNTVIAVGEKAYKMLGRTPRDISIVHPLKGGVIADIAVTEQLLEMFIHKLHLNTFFQKPDILICTPTNVTTVEQKAIIQAAIKCGGHSIYLEEEPKVAAVGVGLDIFSPSGNMIVDIGGGTSDIAVLSMGATVSSRSIKLAGDDMDHQIMDYIKEKYQLIIGERTAEAIKMDLGSAIEVETESDMIVKGRDMTTGLPKTVTIYTNEIYHCLKEILDTICEETRLVLEDTPPELAGDIIERGIVVTGGGALIHGIDRMLSERLQVPVFLADNPLESVAIGTGVLLDRIKRERGLFDGFKRLFSSKRVVMNPTANIFDDEANRKS